MHINKNQNTKPENFLTKYVLGNQFTISRMRLSKCIKDSTIQIGVSLKWLNILLRKCLYILPQSDQVLLNCHMTDGASEKCDYTYAIFYSIIYYTSIYYSSSMWTDI